MNLIDSSAWVAYFLKAKTAGYFTKAIEEKSQRIVPSIVIYEVFKTLFSYFDEKECLLAIAFMKEGIVVDLNIEIALRAAEFSRKLKLGMADSIIFATADLYEAVIWTQDVDFKGLKRVRYYKK